MELLTPTSPRQAPSHVDEGAFRRAGTHDGPRRPAANATLVVDDERRCLEASLGACRLFGAARADLEGHTLEELFEPAAARRVVHFWRGFAPVGGTAGPFPVAGPQAPLEVTLTLTEDVVPGRHVVGIQPADAAFDAVPAPGVRVPSARERQILALLAEGETDAQIAARLGLSPATVQTHVRNAKAKLGARTRAQAVALALRSRLIAA
jgi:DNA-binding CsgD family transcriptional regulator